MTPRKHLLLDYGQVICLPQPAGDLERLAELAGLSADELTKRYWLPREPYDRGGSARDYWSAIMGMAPDEERLRELAAQDTASWLHLDPVVIRALDGIHDAGAPISLLSNAPHELARALSEHEVFVRFEHLLFSAELGMTKPDPVIYTTVMSRLDAAPADIVFVDDRVVNVKAAAELGFVALHYTGHDSLDEIRDAVVR